MSAPLDRSDKPNPRDLPDWVQRAMDATLKAVQQVGSKLPDRSEPLWPMIVDAAVVAGFLPRELSPETLAGKDRANAQKTVLNFAEPVREASGVRWTLTPESRREVLKEVIGTDDLKASLTRTASRFTDPVSNALRNCLSNFAATPSFDSLEALEASRTALSWLSGIPGLTLPSLDEIDREIELRRLLAPFARMIGQRSTAGETQKGHRFFGREKELDKLRAYVGVVAPTSLTTRAVSFAKSLVGRSPLAVWGIGGSGKTTLISKFMLEHAEAAASRFPFAYLDFDRTTISGGNRVGILAEICTQVAAQFPSLTEPMLALRSKVVRFGGGTADAAQSDSITRLIPYQRKFRNLIDENMRSLESSFEWARPFLLVFDTFEVVQYSPDDVASLEEFVGAFSLTGESGLWPRLRLIISGRKRVSEFLRQKVEKLLVDALDRKGCTAMLVALTADAGKALSEAQAGALVTALAKAIPENPGAVQPLRIRLTAEAIANSRDDGPTTASVLLREFGQPLTMGGLAAQVLIDGVLVRRIVGHIKDIRVRALADPGLVVRRITADVIRQVMTRATNKPMEGEEDPKELDADVREPWIVDPTEAQNIFEAFKKEVSLVQIEGDALRHRPDVRMEMLPLIRARRPRRFQNLHRVAFQYFSKLAEQDPEDRPSAAEAIYHGLWAAVPLPELDRLWPRGQKFDPRIDPDEFGDDSLANTFILAKTGNPLTAKEFSELPHEITLDWVGARSAALVSRRRIDERELGTIRELAGELFEELDDRANDAAPVTRLLYRCGLWDDALRLVERQLRGKEFYDRRSSERLSEAETTLVRLALTIAAKATGQGSKRVEDLTDLTYLFPDPLVQIELFAHSVIYWFRTRRYWRGEGAQSEPELQNISRKRWLRERRILRLAILVRAGDLRELLSIYFDAVNRLPCDTDLLFSDPRPDWLSFFGEPREFEEIGVQLREGKKREALEALEMFWRRAKVRLIKSLGQPDFPLREMQRLVVHDHADWIHCFGNALTRAWNNDGGKNLGPLLAEGKFIEPKSNIRFSGIETARAALDEGRLLDLARNLREWGYKLRTGESLSVYQPTSYPNDAYQIADALVRWHEALLEMMNPPEPRAA